MSAAMSNTPAPKPLDLARFEGCPTALEFARNANSERAFIQQERSNPRGASYESICIRERNAVEWERQAHAALAASEV